MARSVTFEGQTFQLRDELNEFALLEFAEVAADGEDADSAHGAAAVLRVIRENLAEGEWPKFRALARKVGKVDVLLPVVAQVFTASTDRPTERPSDSSDGPSSTEPRSEAVSSSPVISEGLMVVQQREREGRPDLALLTLQSIERRTA